MKKRNFVSMLMGTVGGILFGVGMCMCLLPEWGAFIPGVVLAGIGAVVLVVMLVVRRRMKGKPAIRLNGKTVGTVALGTAGALVLGTGMCMTMIWQAPMVLGIIVGVVGIMLLMSLIPVVKGVY